MIPILRQTGENDNTNMADEALAKSFSQGDEQAFKQVFNRLYKPLCYFACKIIDDVPAAEDITAESFFYLYTHRHKFTTLGAIKAFLFVANRNACMNYLKAKKRHRASHKEILYLAEDAEEMAPGLQDMHKIIERHLDKLPPQCKEVFKMSFYKQMKTSEIAGELCLATQTVINHRLLASSTPRCSGDLPLRMV
jgi:RNA polymerase sigma-70 factor (family 1)